MVDLVVYFCLATRSVTRRPERGMPPNASDTGTDLPRDIPPNGHRSHDLLSWKHSFSRHAAHITCGALLM